MKPGMIVILVIICLSAVYFLGTGLTGNVISQSCCFGEDCLLENHCITSLHVEEPVGMSSIGSIFVGTMLMFTMLFYIMVFRRK